MDVGPTSAIGTVNIVGENFIYGDIITLYYELIRG